MRIAAIVLFAGVCCSGLGFVLGRGSRADLRAEREAALAARVDEPTGPAAVGSYGASLSPDVLRAELARALAAAAVVHPEAPKPQQPAPANNDSHVPLSPEQTVAIEKARDGVDRAITQGVLTKGAALDLREQLQAIDDQPRSQLTRRLMVALNQNKLRLEDQQLPF